MRGLFLFFLLSTSISYVIEARCNLASLKIPNGSPEPSASFTGPLIDRLYILFRKQNKESELAQLSILGSLIVLKDPAFLSWLQKESQVMTAQRLRNGGVYNPDLELRFSFYKNILTRIEKKKELSELAVSEAGISVLNSLANQLTSDEIHNRNYFNTVNKAIPDEWGLIVKALRGNETFITHLQNIILEDNARNLLAKNGHAPIEQQMMLRAVLYFVNRKTPDKAFDVEAANKEAQQYIEQEFKIREGFSDHAVVLGRKYYKNAAFIEWAEERARHYRALAQSVSTSKGVPDRFLMQNYQYSLIAQYFTEMAEVATNYEPSALPPP